MLERDRQLLRRLPAAAEPVLRVELLERAHGLGPSPARLGRGSSSARPQLIEQRRDRGPDHDDPGLDRRRQRSNDGYDSDLYAPGAGQGPAPTPGLPAAAAAVVARRRGGAGPRSSRAPVAEPALGMDASEPRGEFELIDAIRGASARAGRRSGLARSWCSAPATTPRSAGRAGTAVTSVDALVEGVHFRIPPFDPRSVGHKALATALSDLAAMGAEPSEAYVQLGVAGVTSPTTDCSSSPTGSAAIAAAHRVAIAGGDVSRRRVLIVAVTAVGRGGGRPSTAAPAPAPATWSRHRRARRRRGGTVAARCARARRARAAQSPTPCAGASASPSPRLAAGLRAGARRGDRDDRRQRRDRRRRRPCRGGERRRRYEIDLAPASRPAGGRGGRRAPPASIRCDLAAGGGEDYELLATIPPERFDHRRRSPPAASG